MFALCRRGAILCVFILFFCLTPVATHAQMVQLNDENLSGISGQAGVSINMDLAVQVHYDLLKFSDTQTIPNWIELHDFNVDNGSGGAFSVATRYYDAPVALVTNFVTYYSTPPHSDAEKAAYTWAANEFDILMDAKVQDGTIAGLEDGIKRVLYPITYDISTDSGGRTFVSILNSSATNPRTYSVGSLVINAYDIKDAVALATAMYNYITTNSLTNAQFVINLGLSSGFDYASSTTWTSGDLTILNAFNGGATFGAQVVAYQATLNTQTSQPLGSIKLDALRQDPSLLHFWAHAGQGISFDYATAIYASALTYTYNNIPTALSLCGTTYNSSGINIAGSATGNPQDSDFTTTHWVFSGAFKIGSIGDLDVYMVQPSCSKATNQPPLISGLTLASHRSLLTCRWPEPSEWRTSTSAVRTSVPLLLTISRSTV